MIAEICAKSVYSSLVRNVKDFLVGTFLRKSMNTKREIDHYAENPRISKAFTEVVKKIPEIMSQNSDVIASKIIENIYGKTEEELIKEFDIGNEKLINDAYSAHDFALNLTGGLPFHKSSLYLNSNYDEKKESKSRRGVSKLILGSALAALLGLGAVVVYSGLAKPPEPKFISQPDYPYSVFIGKNANVSVIADADKVLLQTSVNGICTNKTMQKTDNKFSIEIPIEEGITELQKLYAEKGGKTIALDVNKTYEIYDRPKINSFDIIKEWDGYLRANLQITVNATDSSEISDVSISVDGIKYKLDKLQKDLYVTNFSIPTAENLRLSVVDKFGQESSEIKKVYWGIDEAFKNYVEYNKIPINSQLFYSNYSKLVNDLFTKDPRLLNPIFELYTKDSKTFDKMYKNIVNDPQINIDRSLLTHNTSKLFLDLGYYDKVKYLKDGTYVFAPPSDELIQMAINYSVAINQLKFPELEKSDLLYFGNATMIPVYGKDLIDFRPIIWKNDLNSFKLEFGAAESTWSMISTLNDIKYSFDILNHPEMFLGITLKDLTNNYYIKIPYPNIPRVKIYSPEAKEVKKLQWDAYSQFAPQLGGGDKIYNRDMPWYNSTALKSIYSDENEMKIALFNLFALQTETFDRENEFKRVKGIESFKLSIKFGLEDCYEIAKMYVEDSDKYDYYGPPYNRQRYTDWVSDIGYHVCPNAVAQYFGQPKNWTENFCLYMFIDNWMKNNSPDKYLTDNWKYWDLVRYIIGEGFMARRINFEKLPPLESREFLLESLQRIYNEVNLRLFGFPVSYCFLVGTQWGSEVTVCLPPNIAKDLKSVFPDLLFYPGNGFGFMFSCKSGLNEDGYNSILYKIDPYGQYYLKYLF